MYTTKSHAAWLVLNGLWRLDSAAREYHIAVKDLKDVETTRKRWEIGLLLEVVCFSPIFHIEPTSFCNVGGISNTPWGYGHARSDDNSTF